jgi:hypothetical protein
METIETTAQGGKQSKIKGKMTEVPPLALIEVSAVMAVGAERYPREADGTPNWHRIDCMSNLDHALEHAANFMAQRNEPNWNISTMREELSHFAARAMMSLEQFLRTQDDELECPPMPPVKPPRKDSRW